MRNYYFVAVLCLSLLFQVGCSTWYQQENLFSAKEGLDLENKAPDTRPVERYGSISDHGVDFGRYYIVLATHFGMTDYVSASGMTVVDLPMREFKYVPSGQNLENANEIALVDAYNVGNSYDVGAKGTAIIFEDFLKKAGQNGSRIIEQKSVVKPQSGLVGYVEYEVSNPVNEHNLALLWQFEPGVVSIFQLRKYHEKHSPEDIEKFKDVVQKYFNTLE